MFFVVVNLVLVARGTSLLAGQLLPQDYPYFLSKICFGPSICRVSVLVPEYTKRNTMFSPSILTEISKLKLTFY